MPASLVARPPHVHHHQNVIDIHDAVVRNVGRAHRNWRRLGGTFAPGVDDREQVIDMGDAVVIGIADAAAVPAVDDFHQVIGVDDAIAAERRKVFRAPDRLGRTVAPRVDDGKQIIDVDLVVIDDVGDAEVAVAPTRDVVGGLAAGDLEVAPDDEFIVVDGDRSHISVNSGPHGLP